MYKKFSAGASKVMQLANQEARRLNHEYIGTEHVLLGLVKEGSGVAVNVLKRLDIDLREVRHEVEKRYPCHPSWPVPDALSWSIGTCAVVHAALHFAAQVPDDCAGTEHLLYGLLDQPGVAQTVLAVLGLHRDAYVAALTAYKYSRKAGNWWKALTSEVLSSPVATVADAVVRGAAAAVDLSMQEPERPSPDKCIPPEHVSVEKTAVEMERSRCANLVREALRGVPAGGWSDDRWRLLGGLLAQVESGVILPLAPCDPQPKSVPSLPQPITQVKAPEGTELFDFQRNVALYEKKNMVTSTAVFAVTDYSAVPVLEARMTEAAGNIIPFIQGYQRLFTYLAREQDRDGKVCRINFTVCDVEV